MRWLGEFCSTKCSRASPPCTSKQSRCQSSNRLWQQQAPFSKLFEIRIPFGQIACFSNNGILGESFPSDDSASSGCWSPAAAGKPCFPGNPGEMQSSRLVHPSQLATVDSSTDEPRQCELPTTRKKLKVYSNLQTYTVQTRTIYNRGQKELDSIRRRVSPYRPPRPLPPPRHMDCSVTASQYRAH
jgi:hypothetical protein